MKKYILILLAAILGLQGMAQESKTTVKKPTSLEEKQIDSVCKLVVKYANLKDTKSIYDLGSEEMHGTMDYETFKAQMEANLYPRDKILRAELLDHKNGRSTYNIVFKDISYLLDMSLNEDRKFVAFSWRLNPKG